MCTLHLKLHVVNRAARFCPGALLPARNKLLLKVPVQYKSVFLGMFHFQAADEGEYQCLAESEAGTAERTITLKVQSEFF